MAGPTSIEVVLLKDKEIVHTVLVKPKIRIQNHQDSQDFLREIVRIIDRKLLPPVTTQFVHTDKILKKFPPTDYDQIRGQFRGGPVKLDVGGIHLARQSVSKSPTNN